MWRLLVPFDYLLRFRHPEKWMFDFVTPAVATALCVSAVLVFNFRIDAFGDAGLITNLQSLTSILTGFYIAALAAVATFPSKDMDKLMPGKIPMVLKRKVKGYEQVERLTRRRFLSLMFGYTAAVSFLLYLFGAVGKIIGPQIIQSFPDMAQPFIRSSLLAIYIFVFMNLVVTTFLGLFYLSDRIHRGNTGIEKGTESDPSVRLPAE